MKNNTKKLLFLFFLLSIFGYSQQNKGSSKEKKPLTELIKSIEKQFEVRFSFDPNLVKKHECIPFNDEKSLDENLAFLEKETNLVFEKIDTRYIIIREKIITTNLSVCGFLVDENTKLPVSNATVWVVHKSLVVSSDQEGYFELKGLQSDWKIRIDYLGYNSLLSPVFKMQDRGCVKIELSETNEELDEVLISDYLTQGVSKKRDGAIRVSPKSLGILPGLTEPDVLQSLQMLPGVQSPGETASGIHVRGGTPDQNLVLFDGIKMYDSGHFFGLISSFNPYVTKKIDFYKSGTRAKFGDRIGGVLDITSGDAVPDFSTGFGLNLLHADAFVKAPLFYNKVGLILSARRSLTDIWNTTTYKSFSESVFQNTRIIEEGSGNLNALTNVENTFFFHDYNLKLIADITEKDKLVFSNLFNKNNLEYYAENERFFETNNDNVEIKNQGSNLKWTKFWNQKWSHTSAISLSEYILDYNGERIITRRDPSKSISNILKKYNKVKDLDFKVDFEKRKSEISTWMHGYQFSKNEVQYIYENSGANGNGNQILEADDSDNSTHAFFTEYSYTKDQKWKMNLGIRFNYFSVVRKTYVEPRFFLSNQVSDSFQLKFSAEVKNQVLSQIIEFRNTGLGLVNDIWALSNNKEIPVLNNYQITGGFLFQKNGWNFDVDVYHKLINGLTLLTEDVVTKAPQYLAGESKTNGVDFLLKKRFGNYRSWISYTMSKTKFTYDGINKGNAFDGEYDIPHSLVWSHTYTLKKMEFSLGWKIRSGTPYTKGIDIVNIPNGGNRILYENAVNTNRLPTYNKIDFSATYKFSFSKTGNAKGKIGLSLMNVFDQSNILDRSYEIKIQRKSGQKKDDIKTLVETDQLSIGFTPNIVFRVSF